MRAAAALAAVAALVWAGCGGTDGTPAEGVAGTTAGQSDVAPAPDARPTPAEVRWAGRALDWARRVQADADDLVQNLAMIDADPGAGIPAARKAFDRLERQCAVPLDRPATQRQNDVHEALVDYCTHFERGLESLEVLLSADADDTSAQVDAWVREFEEEWTLALRAGRKAGSKAAEYAPTNARPLPKRNGGAASHVAPKLGRAASQLAGEEIVVQCWSKPDWERAVRETSRFLNERFDPEIAGFVVFGDHRINLPPDVCAALEGHGGDEEALAFGVATLAHEARHVSGTVNETTATCQSIDDLPKAARLLGLGEAAGRDLAAVFRERIRPTLPPAYRAFDC